MKSTGRSCQQPPHVQAYLSFTVKSDTVTIENPDDKTRKPSLSSTPTPPKTSGSMKPNYFLPQAFTSVIISITLLRKKDILKS